MNVIISKNELDVIIEDLKQGNVVAIPTDTVYGVAAIINDQALVKLFELKQRENKPIAVLAYNLEQIKSVVNDISFEVATLVDQFLPGPLTLVLEKKEGLSDILTQGLSTVGVRIPNDSVTLQVLKEVGPLAVTSANLSGEVPINTPSELELKFPEIKILEGEVKFFEASTVLLVAEQLKILRKGPISLDQIKKALDYKD